MELVSKLKSSGLNVDDEVYEDINHGIPNALVITEVLILIFKSKYDIVNILESKI